MKRIRFYRDFTDDFYVKEEDRSPHKSKNTPENLLPENYNWMQRDLLSKTLSALVYGTAIAFSSVWCRAVLHVRIKGKEHLKEVKNVGFFLYGNHTQSFGDVFHPGLVCFPKRVYTIVHPNNLSLPIIGKILPYLGALPTPQDLHSIKSFNKAIEERIGQNCCVTVFPEAHVWDYCSFIRPFPDTSFRYPLKNDAPVYVMTTTYQKRKFGKKPAITIYVDGPIRIRQTGNIREDARLLRDEVYDCMVKRSENSNYSYIEYIQAEEPI